MAKDIKQRSIIKDIKAIDRTIKVSPKGQKQITKMKDEVSSITDNRRDDTPSGYADKKISGASREIVYTIHSSAKRIHGIKTRKANAEKTQIKTKEYTRRFFERSVRNKSVYKANASSQGGADKVNTSLLKTKDTGIKSKAVQIKAKHTIHRKAYGKTIVASEKAGRNKAIKEMATSKMAKNAAKKTAIRNAKIAKEALARMVKLIVASMRSLIAALGAGGALVVFIMIFIILIGAIASSPMGIFFSNDNGNALTMKSVIEQLNTEFAGEVKKVEDTNPNDETRTVSTGPYINWKEVLAIYACRVTEDKDNPLDVVTIDETRIELLRTIMFDMNKVTSEMITETRETTSIATDDEGNETEVTETVTVNILVITITHKTAYEMADEYLFSNSQRKSLDEILDPANDELWTELLSGIIADGGFVYTGGTLNWPCQGTFTSGFGPRWGSVHEGIDIANSAGTPIYAAADGEVFYSQWNSGGYGYQVRIDHGGGIVTSYAHNSSLVASAGQKVKRGDLIALMGTTGDSTGNHCHFEVRVNGIAQDPLNWL